MEDKEMRIVIDGKTVVLDGCQVETKECGEKMLTELYRRYVGDYPKFFKMDTLSKLGFIASELLLQREASLQGVERFVPSEERGVIMGNRSASIVNDREYEKTIQKGDYYPSPALFVYTLPNIVTGEIAIRNKFYGESGFYVVEDKETLMEIVRSSGMKAGIVGWVECRGRNDFEADVELI